MKKLSGIAALCLAVVGSASAPAQAAPATEGIPLTGCTDGRTYEVVLGGNGDFDAGRDVTSHAVFVPSVFRDLTTTVTAPGQDPVVIPGGDALKGNGNVAARNPRDQVTCSFSIVIPGGDGSTTTVSGVVTGFVTPG